MGFWFKRNKKRTVSETIPAEASSVTREEIPETAAEEEGSADTAVASRQFWNSGMSAHDWISEMYREQERKGAFEHLAGKGKPLDIPSGDLTNRILKEANFLPAWLSLQHEIRDQLNRLLDNDSADISNAVLDELNAKITKYNSMVPTPALQKWKLTRDNMRQQLDRWK